MISYSLVQPKLTLASLTSTASLSFCDHIGVPIKQEKTASARIVITFMGLELDSVAMAARLPADKLSKVRGKLLHLSRSRKVTLNELRSLLGLLIF